ncbi:carbon-nitrogen hydrolase family protein [Fusibacter paucivorans]|uniref:Carbon-nitrogen hydrolase family protein n=1 Tax=Fusibacter paucivorans TaxID=76009 RepID=A0ABS5PSB1_9FIRM|nr:carbon-nitrogen hydrolase family protein [Fusibacter paucivorans]MBS7528054.1 carbon-nitrogen hydrolase family protein [Fusibacter paucivorans]
MSRKLCLGVIQMAVDEQKANALKKAVSNIDYLSTKGANVVVLPEMFNCPYETLRFPDYAETAGGTSYQTMAEAAKRNGIYIIAGSMPEREGTKIYNTSFIFGPDGNCLGRHRKMHLFDIDIQNGQYFMESETLTPGNDVTVVDTEFGKIGVALCYDVRFPELARLMTEQGAKLLIYPAAFNMTTGPMHWELLLRSRAVDQQVFTVGCAPARQYDSSYISYGNSMIVSPWGDIMGRLNDEEGYLLGEIDFEEVAHVRTQLPVITQLRKDLYELKLLKESL